MDKYEVQDMVINAVDQKPLEFRNAFNDVMLDKIRDAVALKKIEVAQRFFNTPEPVAEPEPETAEQPNNENT